MTNIVSGTLSFSFMEPVVVWASDTLANGLETDGPARLFFYALFDYLVIGMLRQAGVFT